MKLKHSLIIVTLTLFTAMVGVSAMAEEKKDATPAAATATEAPKAPEAAAPATAPTAAPAAAAPATPPDVKPVLNTGDTAWMLVSSALVLLMIPGLALFYGGMVRQKNVLSTMMHSFVAMGSVGVQGAVIG